MKALSRFEEFLENIVEGSLRRLFRGRLEPVDLARRLARVMDDNKRVTWERPLVPNQYRIRLSEADFTDIQSYLDSLQRELERFVNGRAEERGYGMLGPASVVLAQDAALSAGEFAVQATLADAPGPSAAAAGGPAPDEADFGQTRAMRPLEMPLGPTGYETLCLVGQVSGRRASWTLAGARVTVGRGLDNDVVLEDASVSRHHAEIIRQGGRTEVRDLGSMNGTWVNARRTTAAPLHAGDQVAFGAVQLEVTRRPNE